MTNYYEELNLDASLSVEELQKNLNKLESTWIRREATNPEKARAMRVLIDEARKAFQTEGSRAQYDRELKNADHKPPVEDERAQEREKWLNEANAYYQMGQYDLAKTAVQRALQYLNPGELNDVPYSIAADIYYQAGEPQRALEYVNNAIMDNNTSSYYFIRLASIYFDLSKNRNLPNFREYLGKVRPTIEIAMDLAKQYGNEEDQGNAIGCYAHELYFHDPKDVVQAEELAKEAIRLGDIWGNAQKVLDNLEAVRKEQADKEYARKKSIYTGALKQAEANEISAVEAAIKKLEELGDFEDVAAQITSLKAKIEDIRRQQEEEEKQKRRKKKRKITAIIVTPVVLALVGWLALCKIYFDRGVQAMADEQSTWAYDNFKKVVTLCPFYPGAAKRMKEIIPYEEGEIVTFGSYEQDGDLSNGPEPIEWIVIHGGPKRIALISRYVLEAKPYNDTVEPINWEQSSLRRWLNVDFYESAFTDEEKKQMLNSQKGTNGYKVGLAGGIYVPDEYEETTATPYAEEKVLSIDGNACYWNEYTHDYENLTEVILQNSGERYSMDYEMGGVRPCIYMDWGIYYI